MNNQVLKLLILGMLLFAVAGCRSKKSFTENHNREVKDSIYVTEKVIDTVFKDRVIEKTKPVFYEVEIEKPCDSLGNLMNFNYKVGSGGNSSTIYSRDGKLYLETRLDSILNVKEKEYRSRWEQDSLSLRNSLISESQSAEEIVRYVYPWWIWLVIVIGSLFGILWLVEKFDVISRIRKAAFKI